MDKRALLIYPPTGLFDRTDRCQSPVEEEAVRVVRPPMDLAYIAATLEQSSVECRIIDYPAEKKEWGDLAKDIQRFNPTYLFFSSTTPTFEKDMEVCKVAKSIDKDILTIVRGPYISANTQQVFNEHPELDIAIIDEPEFAAQEIVEKEDLSEVLGIAFINGESVVKTKARPFLRDLDLLPFPSRHLIKNEIYKMPGTGDLMTIVLTSRGCPYKCIYCLAGKVSGKRLNLRHPSFLANEIEECYSKYGIKYFWFRSDTFTIHKDWVIQVCKEIVDRKLPIKWSTNSRVDTIDEERLFWMKKGGCLAIGYGIESGNQAILDKIKKDITLDQARKAVMLTKKYNIKAFLFFMIGFPWDSKDTISETIDFAKELKGDLYSFAIAYPHPGTEMYEIARRYDLIQETSVFNAHYAKPAMNGTLHLSYDEVVKLHRNAYYQVLLQPAYIMKTLSNLTSLRELREYITSGFKLLYSRR